MSSCRDLCRERAGAQERDRENEMLIDSGGERERELVIIDCN